MDFRLRHGVLLMSLRRLIVLAAVLLAQLPVWAQIGSTSAARDSSPYSDARLVGEWRSVQPGQPFTVALHLQMDAGWHSYWRNPGDSGQPTAIEWTLPDGFSAGSIQWPYPHRVDLGPLTSYGYSDEVFLLAEITPPEDLAPGSSVTLAGRASWLICDKICLTAAEEVSLTLPVSMDPPDPSSWHVEIESARRKLPAVLAEWDIRASRSSGTYALQISPPTGLKPELEGSQFFPFEKGVLDHASPQPVTHEGASHLMALKQSEYASGWAERLQGVLVAPAGEAWDAAGTVRALLVDVPVEDAMTAGASSPASGASMTLLLALLFAFAGGMILNLMPCVFPILSIKILGVARQSDEPDGLIRRHGLVFGLGVVISFLMLAGLFLALRAGGSQIGWGFQLQSPLFVALLAMLFFGIGLNLMGVFEVGMGLMRMGGRADARASTTYRNSFLSGVLATVVATPCTAPLMGAALGFALTLTAVDALLVFTALGMGMALPYVALSMAPGLLRRLPKPGPWMETLRQALAFPMFATTVWLVWVFGQQVGMNGVGALLIGLLLLGATGWMLGRWSGERTSARMRLVTRGVAVIVLIGAVAITLAGAGNHSAVSGAGTAPDEDALWQEFSSGRLEKLRAEGRPVFIDFTAAWCLTCQVNKQTTLNAAAVLRAFRENDVALLKADWTSQDPEITRAIESHGRSGVPLYVLYGGGDQAPIVLPEILTERIVIDAINRVVSSRPTTRTPSSTASTGRTT